MHSVINHASQFEFDFYDKKMNVHHINFNVILSTILDISHALWIKYNLRLMLLFFRYLNGEV